MKSFNKILVANRGEIAVRIFRSLKKMGIKSVAVFSEEERNSFHTRLADESYKLSGEDNASTYKNIDEIIRIAIETGVDAIHPGYGFLSENPVFAEKTEAAGIRFIGPSPSAIRIMGNKQEARKLVDRLRIPLIKSVEGNNEEIFNQSDQLSYPLIVKSVAGGGGKAMRIVNARHELPECLEITAREALNYFDDGRLYAENYYENARHIEIQVLADNFGNILIPSERECSVQRRFQKLIEEAPSLFPDNKTLKLMREAAAMIVKEIEYVNAGTVEFLVDRDMNYYFLEMNTRIQVEHTVNEMVNNLDIVEMQIQIAAGNKLQVNQEELIQHGHAIEARIYAEDPYNDFLPSPGTIHNYQEPSFPGLRIDSGIDGPSNLQSGFDPLISKIIVHAEERHEAIILMSETLGEYVISGTPTNRELLMSICRSSDFNENKLSATWLESNRVALMDVISKEKAKIDESLIFAAWISWNFFRSVEYKGTDVWKRIGYWRQQMRKSVIYCGKQYDLLIERKNEGEISLSYKDRFFNIKFKNIVKGRINFELDGKWISSYVTSGKDVEDFVFIGTYEFMLKPLDFLPAEPFIKESPGGAAGGNAIIRSPLHGKIIKLNAVLDRKVYKGEVLFILDAMKIESKIIAPIDGLIKDIRINEGDQVRINQTIMTILR